MKTISQAAKAANAYGYPNYTGANNEAFYSGFKTGAAFVQRWIPVEEELPEDNGEKLLVKMNEEVEIIDWNELLTKTEENANRTN